MRSYVVLCKAAYLCGDGGASFLTFLQAQRIYYWHLLCFRCIDWL